MPASSPCLAAPPIEHPLVGGDCTRVVFELAMKHAPEAVQADRAFFLAGRFGAARLEHARDFLPIFLLAVDAFEEARDARIFGIELETLFESSRDFRNRLLVAIAVAIGHLAGAHEERRLEGGVRRLLGFFEVAGDELLPLLPLALS